MFQAVDGSQQAAPWRLDTLPREVLLIYAGHALRAGSCVYKHSSLVTLHVLTALAVPYMMTTDLEWHT
jgi:hypothetical protein